MRANTECCATHLKVLSDFNVNGSNGMTIAAAQSDPLYNNRPVKCAYLGVSLFEHAYKLANHCLYGPRAAIEQRQPQTTNCSRFPIELK